MTVSGPVTITTDLDELLPWATHVAARYMGPALAAQYGRRNAAGELLVRLRAEPLVALSNIAA